MPNSIPEEFEQARLQRLANAIEDRNYTVSEIDEKFAPGTHGCHEAMHLASVINDLVDERLCNHPAILRNAEWYRLAATAQEALWNLYQAIGDEHLGA
jgi:hypothetical protein